MKYNQDEIIIKNCSRDKFSGFALIEVLIATTILSVVLLSVYSGISSGLNIIGNSKNYTRSMIIARTLMNEFRHEKMKGVDLKDVPYQKYTDFSYDRITKRYENPLFGPIPVNQTEIKIKWKYKGIDNSYVLTMIYQVK